MVIPNKVIRVFFGVMTGATDGGRGENGRSGYVIKASALNSNPPNFTSRKGETKKDVGGHGRLLAGAANGKVSNNVTGLRITVVCMRSSNVGES